MNAPKIEREEIDLFHLERIARAVLVIPDVDLELLHHSHHLPGVQGLLEIQDTHRP